MIKRLYMPVLAALAGAALIGLLAFGLATQSPTRTLDEARARGLRPAAPATNLKLPLLSGGARSSLASYRGQVVVLNFWASWCDSCKTETRLLERTQHELARHGGTVLGITYQDASTDSRRFARQFGMTYPNLRDPSESLAQAYGTRQVPETFVIDRDGHVAAISRGEVSEAFLNEAVSLAESS